MFMLISLAVRWAVNAVVVGIVALLVPGIRIDGVASLLAVALVLGLLNAYVKPLLVLLTLPLTLVTLGLFLLVINVGLLLVTERIAGWLGFVHFEVDGLLPAVVGAVLISLVGFIVNWYVDAEAIAERFGEGRNRLR
jgi:putative membrane protein